MLFSFDLKFEFQSHTYKNILKLENAIIYKLPQKMSLCIKERESIKKAISEVHSSSSDTNW